MTLQAILFLHRFKSVQMQENGSVWLDAENKLIQTVKTSPTAPLKTYPLAKHVNTFQISQYLHLEDLHKHSSTSSFSFS